MRRSLILSTCVVVILTSWSRPARADYFSVAKDIIRDLIDYKIATEVVPNAAARVPLLCEFFPSSLAAIQATRFSGLPAIMRKEAADVIGFHVAIQLQPPSDTTEKVNMMVAPEDENIAKRLFSGDAQSPNDVCLKAFPKDENGEANTTAVPSFEDLESVATQRLRDCASPQKSFEAELACATAIMTRDVVVGDDSLLSPNLRRLLTALAVEGLADLDLSPDDARRVRALIDRAIQAKAVDRSLAEEIATEVYDAYVQRQLEIIGDTAEKAEEKAKLDLSAVDEIQKKLKVVWPIVSFLASARLDANSFEQALALGQSLAAMCKDSNKTCEAIVKILTATGTDAGRLIRFVEAKDFGGAAGSVIDIVTKINCENADAKKVQGCSEVQLLVLEFVRKLVVYTIDSAGASSEEDFRRAATDLIKASTGPGFRRTWKWNLIYPKLSLRHAYRFDLAYRADGSFTAYPAVDFLSFRKIMWNSKAIFAAGTVSFVDVLGPISELALRPPELEGKGSWETAIVGLLTARLEVDVGVPALTKNIVVGVGLAARPYRASIPDASTRKKTGYCFVYDEDCTDGHNTFGANNLEYSVFVKYVP